MSKRLPIGEYVKLCDYVRRRDNGKCRVKGCGRRGRHIHHIIFRSLGGPDESWNLALVCLSCHHEIHVTRTIELEGDADGELTTTFIRRYDI